MVVQTAWVKLTWNYSIDDSFNVSSFTDIEQADFNTLLQIIWQTMTMLLMGELISSLSSIPSTFR